MQANTRYKTSDHVEHATAEKAESHCLNKAHILLTNILRDIGVENPYAYAQKVIDNDLHKADLRSVIAWLDDSIIPEEVA
jgi:hypothetical protein